MLRYHDPKNVAQIREAPRKMGREDLIGRGPQHLVPPESKDEKRAKAPKARGGERALTKHTGLPPKGFKDSRKGPERAGKSQHRKAGKPGSRPR